MKIRNKILIANIISWVSFLIVISFGLNLYIIRSFINNENIRTEDNLARIDEALILINKPLVSFTNHVAHTQDIYNSIEIKKTDTNKIDENGSAYNGIDFTTYWDKQGNLLSGTLSKYQANESLYKDLRKYHFLSFDYLNTQNKIIYTYILTKQGISAIAATTIVGEGNPNKPNGFLINGIHITPSVIKHLANVVKLDLKLYTLSEIETDPYLKTYFQEALKDPRGHTIHRINKEHLDGFSIIKDINGSPIGIFKISIERLSYMSGMQALLYYLISLFVLAFLFSIIMLYLLNKFIISKLEKLNKELQTINSQRAFDLRVENKGNDEFNSVASEINHMLDIIQSSQESMQQNVAKRTQELQKANFQLQKEITERLTIEKELTHHREHLIKLTHYDALTSLPNRVLFNEVLNKAITITKEKHGIFGVLFINIDGFKKINDAFGYVMGNLVLKEISSRFVNTLTTEDMLARLGGDEFMILLSNIEDKSHAGIAAENILSVFSVPIKTQNNEFFLTASIGICIFPEDGESLEDLQKNADMAMYYAKTKGGNICQYYTKEMDVAAHENIKLESALRKAIQNNEFVLYFQPQLNLSDGTIKRLEALIRWESPELGMINPERFIILAEETNLIIPIGEWALREACKINKRWQEQGYDPIIVSVNISAKQFYHQDVAAIIKKILAETKLDPKYLELEITETAIMENVDVAISKLNHINSMGVNVAIDDFGSGYTSISYLKRFPISILKIDQTFIKGLPFNQNDCAITTSIIGLSHNLKLKVIAEGVETAEQMQFLSLHECDFIQGYFFCRPLPENKIVQQLTKRGEANDSI